MLAGGSPTNVSTPTDNTTHAFAYFTCAASADIVSEFPAIVFLPLFIISVGAQFEHVSDINEQKTFRKRK